jgi:hypothetical protein
MILGPEERASVADRLGVWALVVDGAGELVEVGGPRPAVELLRDAAPEAPSGE